MIRLITFLLLFVCSGKLHATQQEPEKFYWKGKYCSIHNNEFLNEYLIDNKVEIPGKYANSTALWRGYIATYTIVDSFLTLKDVCVYNYNKDNNDFVLGSVYAQLPNQMKGLKIDWYSGLLILPYGEIIYSEDYYLGYAYTNYFVFEIYKGKVVWDFDFTLKEYQDFEDAQFRAYQKTETYLKLKEEFLERKRQWAEYKLTEEYKETAQYRAEQENGVPIPKWTVDEEADRWLKDSMFDDIKKLF